LFDTFANLIFSITVGNDIHSKTGPGEFLDNLSEYETSFRKPFKIWAEKALPVPGSTQFQIYIFVLIYTIMYTAVKSDLPVKLDMSMGLESQAQVFVLLREDGFPILPKNIDPETIPPKSAQILVKDYIEKAWRT
jgi:hypothetical protein